MDLAFFQLTLAYFALYLLVFTVGSVIGSFLNVVAYRLPKGLSFVKGRSFCPACHTFLAGRDMIPVFSFLYLKGRCRYCGAAISLRYPLVELICGLLAVFCVIVYGVTFTATLYFAVIAGLLTVSLIDLDTMEIPNGLIIYLFIPALLLIFLPDGSSLTDHLIGAFCVALPLFIINLIIKDSFGGGDIKLMFVCGLALGFKLTLLAFFLALLTGGSYGAYLLLAKRGSRKNHFAFGPFLALGLTLAILTGQSLLSWYLGLF